VTEKSPADGYFSVYEEHSKTLRTWFVAYGIGAPVFILNSPTVLAALKSADCLKSTAVLFLVGVGLQVVLTALNKAVAWILYAENDAPPPGDPARRKGTRAWRYRAADWISERFEIDLLVDVVTGGLFIVATLRIFGALTGTG
jgi:hypothetical protein